MQKHPGLKYLDAKGKLSLEENLSLKPKITIYGVLFTSPMNDKWWQQ